MSLTVTPPPLLSAGIECDDHKDPTHAANDDGQRQLEDRRRKERVRKQRFRQRQREQIDAQRQLLMSLKLQHRALCEGQSLANETHGSSLPTRFLALVAEIESLRRGNRVMRAQLTQHEQFLFRIMQATSENTDTRLDFRAFATMQPTWGLHDPMASVPTTAPVLPRAHASRMVIERATLVKTSEYDAIITACRNEIPHRRDALIGLAAPVMEMQGWQVRRKLRPGQLEFLFRKHFASASNAEQFANLTWRMMLSLKTVAVLQPTVVMPPILQVVDPHTLVVHRRVKHEYMQRVTCATVLLFKRPLPPPHEGFVICWKSLAPSSHGGLNDMTISDAEGLQQSLVDVSEWIIFDESLVATTADPHPNGGCTVSFGGHVAHPNRQYLEFMSTELIACACRCELAVTGTLLCGIN